MNDPASGSTNTTTDNIPPATPKIYHILHHDNLPSVIEHGCLWSDAEMLDRGILCTTIGMTGIKKDRLTTPVKCHPVTMVEEYVPFYFCPRSVMLFILNKKKPSKPRLQRGASAGNPFGSRPA